MRFVSGCRGTSAHRAAHPLQNAQRVGHPRGSSRLKDAPPATLRVSDKVTLWHRQRPVLEVDRIAVQYMPTPSIQWNTQETKYACNQSCGETSEYALNYFVGCHNSFGDHQETEGQTGRSPMFRLPQEKSKKPEKIGRA